MGAIRAAHVGREAMGFELQTARAVPRRWYPDLEAVLKVRTLPEDCPTCGYTNPSKTFILKAPERAWKCASERCGRVL